jgi:hypothetical protein
MARINVFISQEMCDHIDRSQVFLSVPLPVGKLLRVSPKGHLIFNWLSFPTAQKCIGCDTCWSGLIAQRSFLAVILIFEVLEDSAHDTMSEQSIPDETLEGTLCRTPQMHKVVLFVLWYHFC